MHWHSLRTPTPREPCAHDVRARPRAQIELSVRYMNRSSAAPAIAWAKRNNHHRLSAAGPVERLVESTRHFEELVRQLPLLARLARAHEGVVCDLVRREVEHFHPLERGYCFRPLRAALACLPTRATPLRPGVCAAEGRCPGRSDRACIAVLNVIVFGLMLMRIISSRRRSACASGRVRQALIYRARPTAISARLLPLPSGAARRDRRGVHDHVARDFPLSHLLEQRERTLRGHHGRITSDAPYRQAARSRAISRAPPIRSTGRRR